jgi:hypothetical protein
MFFLGAGEGKFCAYLLGRSLDTAVCEDEKNRRGEKLCSVFVCIQLGTGLIHTEQETRHLNQCQPLLDDKFLTIYDKSLSDSIYT